MSMPVEKTIYILETDRQIIQVYVFESPRLKT